MIEISTESPTIILGQPTDCGQQTKAPNIVAPIEFGDAAGCHGPPG